MDDAEDRPRPKGIAWPDLEPMSIEALNEYIGELEAEIERARADIARKQSVRGAAETFFKR